MTVSVQRGGQVVDGPLSDRPVRVLPQGTAGVVYGGRVYPVYADRTIDLDDQSVPKDLVPEFAVEGQHLSLLADAKGTGGSRSIRPAAWNVETNKMIMPLVGRPWVAETGGVSPVDVVLAWHGRVRKQD